MNTWLIQLGCSHSWSMICLRDLVQSDRYEAYPPRYAIDAKPNWVFPMVPARLLPRITSGTMPPPSVPHVLANACICERVMCACTMCRWSIHAA